MPVHIVQGGDTLYRIARTYGTTVDVLLRLNPGISPDDLQVGMEVRLPGGKPTVRAVSPGRARP